MAAIKPEDLHAWRIERARIYISSRQPAPAGSTKNCMKLKNQRRLIRLITDFMDVPEIDTTRHLSNDADSIACEIEQLLAEQAETDDGQTVLAAALLGRKGGLAKSESKAAASRANGKRGGRPPQSQPSVEALYRREYRARKKAEVVKETDQNNLSIAENSD